MADASGIIFCLNWLFIFRYRGLTKTSNDPIMRYSIILLLTFFAMISCIEPKEQVLADYPNSRLLIQADELYEMLESDDLFLIDTRAETGDSLIPGAVHFASIQQLTDPDHPVQNFLIGPEAFQEEMRKIGLSNNDRVVLYDGGNALSASRLFYALDYYGFSNASLLNGGFQGWKAADYPISESPVEKSTGSFSFDIEEAKFCDLNYVMEASDDPDKIIFDVRSEDEYTGVDERADRSGHIPNAIHLEWNQVLQDDGIPYFKPAGEIQEIYDSLGITRDKEVIPHCHTNVRGSHAYFTLRLMGFDSVRAYEGSWSEYGNHPDAFIQQP